MHTQPLLAIVTSLVISGAGAWTTTLVARASSPPVPASADTSIVVNTFEDELNIDGNCSLREAIQAANTDQKFDECRAGQGADSIELPAGTYILALPGADEDGNATGDLDILSNLALHGAWSGVTIMDGNGLDRVLHVHRGASAQVSGVTIRNGLTPRGLDDKNGGGAGGEGGGIWNEGDLALLDCSVVANRTGSGGNGLVGGPFDSGRGGRGGRGGGIANSGALTLTLGVVASNVTGDGGAGGVGGPPEGSGDGAGIFNIGQLVITASTVRDNRAGDGGSWLSPPGSGGGDGGDGGGIANQGRVIIVASTVSGNIAGPSRGAWDAIHGIGGAGGDGGGISNHGSAAWLSLVNSTISGNHAGDGGDAYLYPGSGGDGGGIHNDALLTASNVTITGNRAGGAGSGLNSPSGPAGSGGGISNQNSAEIRNTILAGNAAGGNESECQNTLTSKGYNYVQDVTGCVLAGDLTGNITGREPHLGPLANNGGPTWTHVLLPGSPAIDAGSCFGLDDSPVPSDQRGAPRPQGQSCDMGAYEAAPSAYLYLPLALKGLHTAAPLMSLYLPLALKGLRAPVLNDIANADGDGNYTVSWNTSTGATSYTLEEDDNAAFSSPETRYSGWDTSWNAIGKAVGTYYYRVQESNTWTTSEWSNVASAVVRPSSTPTSGFWQGTLVDGTPIEFYITADRAYVDDFATYVSSPFCAQSFKITHTTQEPISGDGFAFTGLFYASGRFDSETTASGTMGLSDYPLPGCGSIGSGAFPWTANWTRSAQPAPAEAAVTGRVAPAHLVHAVGVARVP
jgi:CSLREA domain-containing protein